MQDNPTPTKGESKDGDLTVAELLELLATSDWLLEVIIRLTRGDDGDDQERPS